MIDSLQPLPVEANPSFDRNFNSSHFALQRHRILALKENGIQPLFDHITPAGQPSPSPSLLVEKIDAQVTNWTTTIAHIDQMIALYLKPVRLQHALKGSRARNLQLNRGDTAICMRDHQENIHWRGAFSILCVRISDSALKEASQLLLGCERVDLQPQPQANDLRLTNLLYALEAEHAHGYSTGRLFLDSLETALAALLVTSYSRTPDKQKVRKGELTPQLLHRILEFMHANIDKNVALHEIANCVGLSSSHFSHLFRKSMRVSPHKYMLTLRIERSKELLKTGRMSVFEVAIAVGFESQQHFATAFRRTVGITPSSYRRYC